MEWGSRRRIKGVRAEQGGQKAEKGKERKAQKLSLGGRREAREWGARGQSRGGGPVTKHLRLVPCSDPQSKHRVPTVSSSLRTTDK